MSDFWSGKYVKAKKDYNCIYCGELIPKSEKHYHGTGVWMGDWQNWRMHNECIDDHDKNGDPDGYIHPGEAKRPKALNHEKREQQG